MVQGHNAGSFSACHTPMALQCQPLRWSDVLTGADILSFPHALQHSFLHASPEGLFQESVTVTRLVFMFYLYLISASFEYGLHLSDDESKQRLSGDVWCCFKPCKKHIGPFND